MLPSELLNNINKIWETFWIGGLPNPIDRDRTDHLPVF